MENTTTDFATGIINAYKGKDRETIIDMVENTKMSDSEKNAIVVEALCTGSVFDLNLDEWEKADQNPGDLSEYLQTFMDSLCEEDIRFILKHCFIEEKKHMAFKDGFFIACLKKLFCGYIVANNDSLFSPKNYITFNFLHKELKMLLSLFGIRMIEKIPEQSAYLDKVKNSILYLLERSDK